MTERAPTQERLPTSETGPPPSHDSAGRRFCGHYDSPADYAEQLFYEAGYDLLLDAHLPPAIRGYIAVDSVMLSRDLQSSGDVTFTPADDGGVWVFAGR